MDTNRRAFFAFLAGAPAAAALARPLLDAAPAPGVHGLAASVPVPPVACRKDAASAILEVVADRYHDKLMEQLVLGRLARRDFVPEVAMEGDTVNYRPAPKLIAQHVPKNGIIPITPLVPALKIDLTKHWETTTRVPDIEREMRYGLDPYIGAHAIAMAQSIDQELCTAVRRRKCDCLTTHPAHRPAADFTKAVLVTRRLPAALPGTGALSHYVERGGVGIRAIMSYDPEHLSQLLTFDVLAGVGVLA
jgi:hypothetical protein